MKNHIHHRSPPRFALFLAGAGLSPVCPEFASSTYASGKAGAAAPTVARDAPSSRIAAPWCSLRSHRVTNKIQASIQLLMFPTQPATNVEHTFLGALGDTEFDKSHLPWQPLWRRSSDSIWRIDLEWEWKVRGTNMAAWRWWWWWVVTFSKGSSVSLTC